MRILFLDLIAGFGGAEKYCIDLAIELNKQNHTCFFLIENEPFQKELLANNLIVKKIKQGSIKNNIWRLGAYINECSTGITEYLKENKIEITINMSERGVFLITRLKLLNSGVKFYHYCHTTQRIDLLYLFVHQYFDKIFVVSEYLKSTFPNRLKNKVEVIPNGFKTYKREEQIKSGKKELIVLSMACVLSPLKSIETAIFAIKRLIENGRNAKLYLLCITEYHLKYYKKLLTLIRKLALEPYISIQSNCQNVLDIFSKSDFVLLTSISKYGGPETFGRTIIEGWLAGAVVVSTNCGGPAEIIQNGYNGFLFRERHYVELAQIIEEVVDNNDLRSLIVQNSSKSLNKYSINTVVSKLCNSLSSYDEAYKK